jgi:hypothetical protein
MTSELYFVSQFFSFSFSMHFVYSNTIYDTTFSVHSMMLKPISTALCPGQHTTRELHFGGISLEDIDITQCTVRYE